MPVQLVEPDEPAHVGDRAPCHLFAPEVAWPVPPAAVLRADKPTPPRVCPPCTGNCHQGRTCPVASAAMARHIRDANIPSVSERTFWWTVAGIAGGYALMIGASMLLGVRP